MPHSPAITDFQKSCQKHLMCYVVASQGIQERAKVLLDRKADRSKTVFVGTGHPEKGSWHGSMNIGEFLDQSVRDGPFSDQIAKSFLTTIFAEWDELHRHKMADEAGVSQREILCDLMGDLRIIRHCIVHKKSIITDEHEKVKELEWRLKPGQMHITNEMFCHLIDQINKMQVRVERM